MAEKTISAPIGRKKRGAETTTPVPSSAKTAEPAAAKTGRRTAKEKPVEAYRSSDAAAKNAEVRKSREMKRALLAEAKGGGKAASAGKSGKPAPSRAGEKPAKPSKHRKGPPKAGSASGAKSGGARKPKAKS